VRCACPGGWNCEASCDQPRHGSRARGSHQYRDPALYDVVQADSTGARMCQTLIERHWSDARTGHPHQRMDVVTCRGHCLAYVHDNDEITRSSPPSRHIPSQERCSCCVPPSPRSPGPSRPLPRWKPRGDLPPSPSTTRGTCGPRSTPCIGSGRSFGRRSARRDPQARPVPSRAGTLRGVCRLRCPGHERRHRGGHTGPSRSRWPGKLRGDRHRREMPWRAASGRSTRVPVRVTAGKAAVRGGRRVPDWRHG